MPNSRELLRVGIPTRAVRVHALIDALELDHSSEATVRFSRGALIIEEPIATVAAKGTPERDDADDGGDDDRDKAAE